MNRNFVAFVALTAIGIVLVIPVYAREQPAQPPVGGVPSTSDDGFNAGIDLYDAGRYTEAIAKYTKEIARRKTFSDAYLNRGKCYTEIGELDPALADFDYYIHRQPNSSEGYVGRASVFRLQKKYEKAFGELRIAFAKAQTPRERVTVIYSRGSVYLAMGDYEKAIGYYSEYISQATTLKIYLHPPAYQERGNALMMRYLALEKRGATTESRKAYEDAQRDLAEYQRYVAEYARWNSKISRNP